MSTAIQPVDIPVGLAQWQPACDMFEDSCANPATHALVTHGGCRVRLTCGACYDRFKWIFNEWIETRLSYQTVVCAGCHAHLHAPWDALHLEPI